MNKRPVSANVKNKYITFRNRNPVYYKKPFWLPAVSYYFLAVGVVIAAFFIVWWFLQDPRGGTPWIPAGIFSSALLIAIVLLREIILRNAMNRYLIAKRRLDSNLNHAVKRHPQPNNKLTLKRNSVFLRDIERKSDAARTLRQLPDAHLEVFEVCEEYLRLTGRELESIRIGSTRLGAIRKGRRRVKELHKYHLLTWAAVESGFYTQEAHVHDTIAEKIENSEKALNVLNTALQFYPGEIRLLESADVIKEVIATARVKLSIEVAEQAAEARDYRSAIKNYKEALHLLAREDMKNTGTEKLASTITNQMVSLRNRAEESAARDSGDNHSDDLEENEND